MLCPSPFNVVHYVSQVCHKAEVTYKGSLAIQMKSHVNTCSALDATVLAYNSINMLRKQMKPNWRVHGIISDGSTQSSIIPKQAKLEFWGRTVKNKELLILSISVKYKTALRL